MLDIVRQDATVIRIDFKAGSDIAVEDATSAQLRRQKLPLKLAFHRAKILRGWVTTSTTRSLGNRLAMQWIALRTSRHGHHKQLFTL